MAWDSKPAEKNDHKNDHENMQQFRGYAIPCPYKDVFEYIFCYMQRYGQVAVSCFGIGICICIYDMSLVCSQQLLLLIFKYDIRAFLHHTWLANIF